MERRLLVRSLSQAHAQETALRARLTRAEAALADLAVRRQDKAPLPDRAAVEEEYLIECSLGRLKGRSLSLAPMYVERDDHATGLVRLLTIASRVLSVVEFVARRQLAQTGETIAGLYAGNPKRTTNRLSTELILSAFREITLTVLVEPQQTRRHVTVLSALQRRLLALLELPSDIYTRLCGDSSEPP